MGLTTLYDIAVVPVPGMERLKGRLEKTHRQARKDSKAGYKRLKGRLQKTQRQARKYLKAG